MSDVQEYIDGRLRGCGHYALTPEDHESLMSEGLEAWLYRRIVSTKFRKWRLPEGTEARVRTALKLCLERGEPLKFVFEFGGYKLWRLPSSPEVDWAEFFTLAHYAAYLAPMAAAYGPGVVFSFASDDFVVERMNNVPKKSTEAYCRSLGALIDQFTRYLPSNLRFELVRLHELYDSTDAVEAELAVTYPTNLRKSADWPEAKRIKMHRKAELNFCMSAAHGLVDLSTISPDDLARRLMEGAIWHDAFEDLRLRRAFVHASDRILIFTTPIPLSVPIGVTKASVAKFWAGTGVLERGSDGWRELVLSPRQIEETGSLEWRAERVSIAAAGLPLRNLQSLPVAPIPLRFGRDAVFSAA